MNMKVFFIWGQSSTLVLIFFVKHFFLKRHYLWIFFIYCLFLWCDIVDWLVGCISLLCCCFISLFVFLYNVILLYFASLCLCLDSTFSVQRFEIFVCIIRRFKKNYHYYRSDKTLIHWLKHYVLTKAVQENTTHVAHSTLARQGLLQPSSLKGKLESKITTYRALFPLKNLGVSGSILWSKIAQRIQCFPLKGRGTFCRTQNTMSTGHRFILNLHRLKIYDGSIMALSAYRDTSTQLQIKQASETSY